MASSSFDLTDPTDGDQGERKKFKPFRAIKRMFREGKKGAKLSKSRGNLTDLSDDEGPPGGYRYKGPFTASPMNRRISLSHDSIFTPEVAKLSSDFLRANPKLADTDRKSLENEQMDNDFANAKPSVTKFDQNSAIAQQLTVLLNGRKEPDEPTATSEDTTEDSKKSTEGSGTSTAIEIIVTENADQLLDDMETVVSGTSAQHFLNNTAAYDKIAARPKNRRTNHRRSKGVKRPASAGPELTESINFWDESNGVFDKAVFSSTDTGSRTKSTSPRKKPLESAKENEAPEESKTTVRKSHSFKGPGIVPTLQDMKGIKLRKTPTDEKKDFSKFGGNDNKKQQSPTAAPHPKPRWTKVTKTTSSPACTEQKSTKSPDNTPKPAKFSPPKVKKRTESLNQSTANESPKKLDFKPSWLNVTPVKKEDDESEKTVKTPNDIKQYKLTPVETKKPESEKSPNEEVNYLAVLEKKKSLKKDSFKKEKPLLPMENKGDKESSNIKETVSPSPMQEERPKSPFVQLKKVRNHSGSSTGNPPSPEDKFTANDKPSFVDNMEVDDSSPVSKVALLKAKMGGEKENSNAVQRKHSGRQVLSPKPIVIEKEVATSDQAKDEPNNDKNIKQPPPSPSKKYSPVKDAKPKTEKGPNETNDAPVFAVKLKKTRPNNLQIKENESAVPTESDKTLNEQPVKNPSSSEEESASKENTPISATKGKSPTDEKPSKKADKKESKEIVKSPKHSVGSAKSQWQSNSSRPQFGNPTNSNKENSEKIVPKWKVPNKPQVEKLEVVSNGKKVGDKPSVAPKSPAKSPTKLRSQFVAGNNIKASWNKNNSNIAIKEVNDALDLTETMQVNIQESLVVTETKVSPPAVAKKPKSRRVSTKTPIDPATDKAETKTSLLPKESSSDKVNNELPEVVKDQNENVTPGDGPSWVSLARRRSKKWETAIAPSQLIDIMETTPKVTESKPVEIEVKPPQTEDPKPTRKPSIAETSKISFKSSSTMSQYKSNRNNKSMEENRPPMEKTAALRSISTDSNSQGKVEMTKTDTYKNPVSPPVDAVKQNPPPWFAIAMAKQKRWVDGTV